MKSQGFKVILVIAVTFLSSCANGSKITTTPPPTQISLERCIDDQGPGWHIFSYDVATGRHTQLTDGKVSDSSPTFSPDGKQIAFIRNNSAIQILNLDEARLKTLTEHEGHYSSLNWSPDGAQFAFVADWTGKPQIYLMNANGENVRPLSAQIGAAPSWSPDSRQIAFLAPSNFLETMAVYTVTVDTQPSVPKEVLARFCSPGQDKHCGTFHDVAWSPDGLALACITESSEWSFVPSGESWPLLLEKSDGISIVTVRLMNGTHSPTTLAWAPIGSFESLSWSPDGRYIAYYDNCGCGSEAVHRVDTVTQENKTLFQIPVDTGHAIAEPAWSPDGKIVVYSRISCIP